MTVMLFIIPLIIAFLFISKARVSLGKTQKAAALYLALLLIAVPVYYVVAEPVEPDPTPERDHVGNDDAFWEEHNRRINEFYEAAHEQRLGDYEGARVAASQEFAYEGEELLITAPGFEHYGSLILLDRKDVDDGKLEIIVYEPRLPYRSAAVSNPPEFALEGTRLKILQPGEIRVEEIRFYHDLTMAQFTGRGLRTGSVFIGEYQIIYLRIPGDLRIETDKTTEYSIIRSPENK